MATYEYIWSAWNFQLNMSGLMAHLKYIIVYLDNLLFLTINTFHDHLIKLKTILQRLQIDNLKINISKVASPYLKSNT